MQEREVILVTSMAGTLAKISDCRKQACDICLVFRRKPNSSVNSYDMQSKYRVGIAPTVKRKIK